MKELHSNNGVAPELNEVIGFLEETIPVIRNSPTSNFAGYKIVVWNAQKDIVLQAQNDSPVIVSEDIVDYNIFHAQYLNECASLLESGLRELAESILKMKDKRDKEIVESKMYELKQRILTASELVAIACYDKSEDTTKK